MKIDSVGGLDHAIIAVGDIGEAIGAMNALGFLPTPAAHHSAHMGTVNSTIVFRDRTYLELLGTAAPTPHNAGLRDAVAAGQSFYGLILNTTDADAALAGFEAGGFGGGEVLDFSRPVEIGGEAREAAFRTAMIAPGTFPGLHSFACQHLTPDVVWRRDHLEQPNGVTGLARLVGAASDPVGAAEPFVRHLGCRMTGGAEGTTIDLGNVALQYLPPDRYADQHGLLPAQDPGIGVIVLRAGDLARVRVVLEQRFVEAHLRAGAVEAERFGLTFRFEGRG